MLATSVTLIFGAGIPVPYHVRVAAIGFFIRYNVEEWVIVSATARPQLYSKKLFDSFGGGPAPLKRGIHARSWPYHQQ